MNFNNWRIYYTPAKKNIDYGYRELRRVASRRILFTIQRVGGVYVVENVERHDTFVFTARKC